jgi:hypothetical protein
LAVIVHADIAESAKKAVAQGFSALKMNATEELMYLDTPGKIVLGRRAGSCRTSG